MMKSRTEISGSSGSFLSIEACDLLDEVKTLKEDGWRFCQACADRLDDGIEIIYTFENTAKLLNLKMVVAEEQTVDSIRCGTGYRAGLWRKIQACGRGASA